MADNELNNPAGRLLRILTAAKNQPKGVKTFEAWAKVLEIDPKDTMAVVQGYADVIRLSQEARQAVEKSVVLGRDAYLKAFRTIDHLFVTTNMQAAWGSTGQGIINDATLVHLQYCAIRLAENNPEDTIPDDKLEELRSRVVELRTHIAEAEIDAALRAHLVENLGELEKAIRFYKIFGADGLRRAAQSMAGVLLLRLPELAPEQEKKWYQKWRQLLIDVNLTVITCTHIRDALPEGTEEAVREFLKQTLPKLLGAG